MSRRIFANIKVRDLTTTDFYIGSRTPTMLKSRSCTLILFYDPDDDTSEALAVIWQRLSARIAGVNFWAVDVTREEEVMKAYSKTKQDLNHPLRDFSEVNSPPTILVYRDGWPQAYYNGRLSGNAIGEFARTLACSPGYTERENLFQGIGGDDDEDMEAIDMREPGFRFDELDSTAFTSDIGDADGLEFDEEELEEEFEDELEEEFIDEEFEEELEDEFIDEEFEDEFIDEDRLEDFDEV